ncbi:MAG: cytochrome c [Beijerinckiaceae bacterium]|nr:cytochrome c [Beijerinckiaceae bacterium]
MPWNKVTPSLSLAIVALAILATRAPAAESKRETAQSVKRGAALAKTLCSRCHSIYKAGSSKDPKAPPFRLLSKNYPLNHLEEAMAEGIVTGHGAAAMPEFTLTPQQITDFITFVKSVSSR